MIPVERLQVAVRARALVVAAFRASEGWRDGVLAVQLRRAVLSVASNIAEGASRESRRDFARFVGIALSSAVEARLQLGIARDLGLIAPPDHDPLDAELGELRAMLAALLRTLRRADHGARPGRSRA